MTANLQGKVVLVTGAARGIGRALCDELIARGATLVAGVRSAADMALLASALGPRARVLACDVASDDSVAAAFAAIDGWFGRIDVLVNNAGTIEPIGRLAQTDPVAWQRAIDVNLVGAYRCARQAILRMTGAGTGAGAGGVIVNVSSGAALRAREGWSAYCASKAGLLMLSQAIHEEYGPDGVQAIGFAPGMVDTPMQGLIRASGINPVSQTPRSKLLAAGEPAAVIGWLCSGRGGAFSGRDIHISSDELKAAMRADGAG